MFSKFLVCALVLTAVCSVSRAQDDDDEPQLSEEELQELLNGVTTEDVFDNYDEDAFDEPEPESAASTKLPDAAIPTCPAISGAVLQECFDDDAWSSRWIPSTNSKFSGRWAAQLPGAPVGIIGDKGLVIQDMARHHAIVHTLPAPIDNAGRDLVVQYEVRLQKTLDCGGAYVKLLSHTNNFNAADFSDSTPYTIMFGPDKCGVDNKVHFIFRHQNPITKTIEEKHLTNPPKVKTDTAAHVYTLRVSPDNSFEIFIDNKSVRKGSLHSDFAPAVDPPREIDDPTDVKPANWVDEPKMKDVTAVKPDDWDETAPKTIVDENDTKPDDWMDDEPEMVDDPESEKPADWDDDTDGEWEPAQIPNPKCAKGKCGEWKPRTIKNPAYKGPWSAPLIDNPDYVGPWAPRQIPNPAYFHDETPYLFSPRIGAVGFEIWTMTSHITFDNIVITHDLEAAAQYAEATTLKKAEVQLSAAPKPKAADVTDEASLVDQLKEGVSQIADLAKEQPVVFAAVLFAALLPLLLCLRYSGEDSAPAPAPAPAPASQQAAVSPASSSDAVAETSTDVGSSSAVAGQAAKRKAPKKPTKDN
eukprot:TRINITY_DN1287_c0_g1_i1.p1 TRINITY_DN1287_c0_g1~~TRINITY_DN1287_c0_g1_i1.p1  ORF type:complete len:584 (+),score=148.77 TRINITY_DN1287_c0_g1_i1:1-1752(+)